MFLMVITCVNAVHLMLIGILLDTHALYEKRAKASLLTLWHVYRLTILSISTFLRHYFFPLEDFALDAFSIAALF